MRAHPYEYKVLVEYINPAEKGLSIHFSHESEQEAFSKIIEEAFERLPGSVPEGWEVNSHSIACARDTIIVTVLLRRKAG